jgi:hypothetical protein
MTGISSTVLGTPSPRSAAKLQKEVAFYVGAPDDPESLELALLGINDAIRGHLNTRNWSWALDYDDLSLTAGTADYQLSSAFRAPRAMELLDSDSTPNGRLDWYDPKTFWTVFPDAGSNGTPSAYTVVNASDLGTFSMNYLPDAAFVALHPTARIRFFRRMEALVLPTDALAAPSDVESFVVWHAKMAVAASMSPDRVSLARSERDKAWKLLLYSEMESQVSDWSEN